MRSLIFTCLALLSLGVNGQVLTESGDLRQHIASIISNMPTDTGNDYSIPTIAQVETWNRALNNLLDSDYVGADLKLDSLNYDLVEFTDTSSNSLFYMLRNNGLNYWGTYVYNPSFCRTTVIQAPHPKYDFNTGKQSVHVFMETMSVFFCMSGTHRCNHSSFSSCDGTTTVCTGSSESFRISDMAHVSNSLFQETTVVLFNRFATSHFLQLHGFAKRSTDPYVIMSNGTAIAPAVDYLSVLKSNLLLEDTALTFKIGHIDTTWDRLLGYTNTQGRFINGSGNPCDDSPTSNSGRFFHIEQEKSHLRADQTGWQKMANAIVNTFVCSNLGENEWNPTIAPIAYPNPTSGVVFINGVNPIEGDPQVFNIVGENITSRAVITQEENSLKIDLTLMRKGVYILQLGDVFIRMIKE